MGQGKYNLVEEDQSDTVLRYQVHLQFFIKQQDAFFIEEKIEDRKARFKMVC